ncbi:MAG: hypothetical protein PUD70_02390 [Firmicutes bacterium]|nr:hypothetical protein [Bacillota bacterium]
MKKWIAVTLALLLMVSIGTVRVDAAKDEKTAKAEKTEKYTILDAAVVTPEIEKKPISSSRESASSSQTADTVTIDQDNGVFTVVTAAGTELSLTAPFGAYCITQDVYQQLEIYMDLYSDISAAVKNYRNNGIHMDIFDYCAGVSTYVAESGNTLAALVGDMNALEDASVKQIADYLSKNWYGGSPALVKTVGGNQYIAFNLAKDYGFVVYNHFTNGKLIEVYTFCEDGAEGMKRVETMIANLAFSAEETVTEETVAEEE